MKFIIILCVSAITLGHGYAQTTTKTTTKKTTTKKTTKKTTTTKTTTTKPKITIPTSISSTISSSVGTGGTGISGLSESEIVDGLKEALITASQNSSSMLNQLDGFNKNMKIRIPFPPECRIVADKLRSMGLGSKVDDFETTLNRAAEQAAREAAPIFVNAIKGMSIVDAKNILMGADTSATAYLRSNTMSSLFGAFNPTVANALNQTFATSKWKDITSIYNRIPFVNKVDTDLPRYATNKALQGLFVVVAEQEQKIRKDPAAQVTELLRKVFGNK